MKTFTNTINKLAMTACLFTSAVSFASGNDRSGNNKVGISIPPKLENQLTESQLLKAATVCRLEEKRFILQQILRSESELPEMYTVNSVINPIGDHYLKVVNKVDGRELFVSFLVNEKFTTYDRFIIYVSGIFDFSKSDRVPKLLVTSEVFENLDRVAGSGSKAPYEGLSTVRPTFDMDRSYDEMGNITVDTKIVTKIVVTSQSNLSRPIGGSKPFVTPYQTDIDGYKACLENELAKY